MFLTNVYYNFNMNYNCAITKQLYATLRRKLVGIIKEMQLEAADIESIKQDREEEARFAAMDHRTADEKRWDEEGPSDSEIEDMEVERLIKLGTPEP